MESLRRLAGVASVIAGSALVGASGCADVLGARFDEATLDEAPLDEARMSAPDPRASADASACGARCEDGGTSGPAGRVDAEGPPSACTPITFYVDGDGDGVGGATTVRACAPPPGTAARGGDCADDRADVFPGQVQRFGSKYKTSSAAGQIKGFDYDCSGSEERDPAAEVLPRNPAPYFTCATNGTVTRGVAPGTRSGAGVDPYCGQTDRYQCAMSSGTCFCSPLPPVAPITCR
jgi:hypothetical protein